MTPAAAAAELLKRRRLRADFGAWCRHVLAPLGQSPAPHHDLIIRELAMVASGETKRLMLNLPPGSAKSTYASVLFPPWFMAQQPRRNVIGASNTATLAESFSRRVMGEIRGNGDVLGFQLGRSNAEMWDVTNGCTYRAAGVGGVVTGLRADLVLIDDPVKSRAEAESEVVRETQWNWFSADLRTRMKPGAAIIVIMTRWHPDDLGGRLLDRQPDLWRVVSLPAIAGDADPLDRQPGEWLWDADPKYGYGAELRKVHAEYEASGATRDWSALYQQKPTDQEGSLFKTAFLKGEPTQPSGMRLVRAWDLAATEQVGTRNPDWTVGVLLGKTPEGSFVVCDVVRERGGPDEVERLITATASRDTRAVPISLPQDPGQAGKSQVLYLTRRLAGFNVEATPETGDKATRAAPCAAQCNVGNLKMVNAAWNVSFKDELSAFPSGAKDDQVDALSRAFNYLTAAHGPAVQRRLGY